MPNGAEVINKIDLSGLHAILNTQVTLTVSDLFILLLLAYILGLEFMRSRRG